MSSSPLSSLDWLQKMTLNLLVNKDTLHKLAQSTDSVAAESKLFVHAAEIKRLFHQLMHKQDTSDIPGDVSDAFDQFVHCCVRHLEFVAEHQDKKTTAKSSSKRRYDDNDSEDCSEEGYDDNESGYDDRSEEEAEEEDKEEAEKEDKEEAEEEDKEEAKEDPVIGEMESIAPPELKRIHAPQQRRTNYFRS